MRKLNAKVKCFPGFLTFIADAEIYPLKNERHAGTVEFNDKEPSAGT